jgi:hypothetical protein
LPSKPTRHKGRAADEYELIKEKIFVEELDGTIREFNSLDELPEDVH